MYINKYITISENKYKLIMKTCVLTFIVDYCGTFLVQKLIMKTCVLTFIVDYCGIFLAQKFLPEFLQRVCYLDAVFKLL